MLRRLMLPLVCCFAGFASSAGAAPLLIDKSDAVADARRDPGTGLCGSTLKFANQPAPLVTIDDATALLNRPQGDPAIVGRVSRLFQNMNFSVGTGSGADFQAPGFNDDAFPFCQDPMANPMGQDDNNLLMRIRGYLNVQTGGQTMTIAVKCDDGCNLTVGRSKKLVTQANDDSPQLTGRRGRWVTFKDPGLYPVELVYFQNSTTGYLEWSSAMGSLFNGDDIAIDNAQWAPQAANFKPISGGDLYSSVIGSNPACIECGAPGMDCTVGNYCGDGLCQSCNVPDHCGPSCLTCPADKHVCSAGKCVQCTKDAECPAGTMCDVVSGTCGPPTSCTDNSQCKTGQICRPDMICGQPPESCRSDSECLAGKVCVCPDYSTSCASTQKVCLIKRDSCIDDKDCAAGYHCDTAAQLCKLNDRFLYEGGLVGCDMSDHTRSSANGLSMLAVIGLALLSAGMRLRRRREITARA